MGLQAGVEVTEALKEAISKHAAVPVTPLDRFEFYAEVPPPPTTCNRFMSARWGQQSRVCCSFSA
jgi:hypothetical protein